MKPNGANRIRVVGAREHNLANISLDLPRGAVIVMTGLSGSGKSSLAFDTIYAEGQRRYVESLSAYARQFLETMRKPDVDRIEGLSPAIAIEQKSTSRNPRSTVATVTEIHDYLRLLFARAGVPYSPATGEPIESQTVPRMVDRLMALPEGVRLHLLAPVARGRKGEFRREIAELLKKGFVRAKIDGALHMLEDAPALNKNRRHDIDVVVDRLIVRPGAQSRFADSLETALALADGIAVAEPTLSPAAKTSDQKAGERIVLSSRFACPVSGFTIPELEPRLFSFNSPHGACPECGGIGTHAFADPELVAPNPSRSLRQGAIAPWSERQSATPYFMETLEALARHYHFSLDTPWRDLPPDIITIILRGSGDEAITFIYGDGARRYRTRARPFEGVLPHLERLHATTSSAWRREDLARYHSLAPCPACSGHRLRPEALAVKIDGVHIGEAALMTIADAARWFDALPARLSDQQRKIARLLVREIRERLRFLNDVGLGYLTLARASATLSGGEAQRIRLASQIGSRLTGVLYVLDEPSIGLHQRDNARLLRTLARLRDIGNTVIVVEHDEDTIRAADHIVDIGPGAGVHGGRAVAQGSVADIMAAPESITGQFLSGARVIARPSVRRQSGPKKGIIRIHGACANNLRTLTVDIPAGLFTCVTGVSGSGKSTLIMDTLYPALARACGMASAPPAPHERIEGCEHIDKVINIDQSPIGRTPRSNPATYTGLFTPVRAWFAGLPEAKARGYREGRFSFNVKGGRCEACQGDGVIRIEMSFLPDVYVQCEECRGARYNRETLAVMFRERSIADILAMSVEEAVSFFRAIPAIRHKAEALEQVGLGYIRLGQPATTLSGGEAQRIKLARELARRATGRTVYILDEPTTGLHFHDVDRLLGVLHALVDGGNTVVVIEHNLDVIGTADHVIDLGPEGGDEGGRVVATGSPEDIVEVAGSHTGRFLAGRFSAGRFSGRRFSAGRVSGPMVRRRSRRAAAR